MTLAGEYPATDGGPATRHAEPHPTTQMEDAMPTSPSPLLKFIGIAFGAIVALGLLTSGGDDATHLDEVGTSSAVDGPSGSGNTQFYDSGSITTGSDGELIYSDSSGYSLSSGG